MAEGAVRLGPGGRTVRVLATTVTGALLLAGTLVGQDDDFPFAPFRMFTTSTRPDGNVTVVAIEVLTAAGGWHEEPPWPDRVGMNRAELEGQQPRFVAEPELLRHLGAAHDRLGPEDPPWTGLRLVKHSRVLAGEPPPGRFGTSSSRSGPAKEPEPTGATRDRLADPRAARGAAAVLPPDRLLLPAAGRPTVPARRALARLCRR